MYTKVSEIMFWSKICLNFKHKMNYAQFAFSSHRSANYYFAKKTACYETPFKNTIMAIDVDARI